MFIQMTVNEIAEVEGVDPSRVRDSIRRGLKQLEKFFDKVSFDAPVFCFFVSVNKKDKFSSFIRTLTIE